MGVYKHRPPPPPVCLLLLPSWREHFSLTFPDLASIVVQSLSCSWLFCDPARLPSHGIFQAQILEWVAISSSRRSSWARDQEVTNPHPVSSALAGRFFTTEPPGKSLLLLLMARHCFSGFPVMLDSTYWADAGFPQHLFWWNTSTTQFPF